MSRKADCLQSSYGFPPMLRQDLADDNVCSEFSAIWENVAHFQHKVLEKDTNFREKVWKY